MIHVRYESIYGSTKEYAEHLAKLCGTTAEPYSVPVPDDHQPVVILSPVHGPSIPAVQLAKQLTGQGHRLAVVAVGMTLLNQARSKDQMKNMLDESITRFYLPGRMNYSELSSTHAAVMKGIINVLKLKPKKSPNDRAMIADYGKDVDRVDVTELEGIIDWARAGAL